MKQITIKDLEKSYGSFTLRVKELEIKKREFFGLIGPSGCGKTTLLRVIAGLEPNKKGKIYLDHEDITYVPTEKRNIGMVFQNPLLFPHMTVEQNIEFGLKMQKMPKAQREERVRSILQSVGLSGFENRYPFQLSGGQQQRIAIARALVCKPSILFMDEPFSALDPSLREEMREFILKIHKSYHITIVFVTHDRQEAFTLFDRMAVVKEGKILQVGCPREIYEKPKHVFVADFLENKNIFQGKVQDFYFLSGNLKFPISHQEIEKKEGYLMLRSECIQIEKIKENKIDQDSHWIATVEDYHFHQGFTSLMVRLKNVLFYAMLPSSKEKYDLGEKVILHYDPKDVWLI